MSPYDPESEISSSSLLRLQTAGFDFAKTLLDRYEFKDRDAGKKDHHYLFEQAEPKEPMDVVVSNWSDTVGRSPIWRSFLEVFQEIGQGEMSQQIEKYLSCGKASFPIACRML